MPTVKLKQVAADPGRPHIGWQLGRDLRRAVEGLADKPAGKSYLIAEFPDEPERAYHYCRQLKRWFASTGHTFHSTTDGGVGRLYCRLPPKK